MTNKLTSLLFASTIFLSSTSVVLAAPKIYLDPTTISVKQNAEFTLPLKIDAESTQIIGTDITLNYAGNDLELIGVDNAGFFSEYTWAPSTSGKLEIHSFAPSLYQTKTGSGTIANLKFKAKKDSGSSTITFGCTSNGSDTNIIDSAGKNILTCNNLNQTLIAYESNTSSPSPSPSSGNSGSSSNTKSPTCTSFTLDPSNATKTPQLVTITCLGNDEDSNITSADIIFGDGTSQTITANPGNSVSISTTHTYTKAGSFTASCKLFDEKNYSTACTKLLSIKLASTPKPTASPSNNTATAKTPVASSKPMALIDYSTSPMPSFTPTEETEQSTSSSNSTWWIYVILIVIGVGGIIYLIKMLIQTAPPPSTPPELNI